MVSCDAHPVDASRKLCGFRTFFLTLFTPIIAHFELLGPAFQREIEDGRDQQRNDEVERSIAEQGGDDLALGQAIVGQQGDEHRFQQ